MEKGGLMGKGVTKGGVKFGEMTAMRALASEELIRVTFQETTAL